MFDVKKKSLEEDKYSLNPEITDKLMSDNNDNIFLSKQPEVQNNTSSEPDKEKKDEVKNTFKDVMDIVGKYYSNTPQPNPIRYQPIDIGQSSNVMEARKQAIMNLLNRK